MNETSMMLQDFDVDGLTKYFTAKSNCSETSRRIFIMEISIFFRITLQGVSVQYIQKTIYVLIFDLLSPF